MKKYYISEKKNKDNSTALNKARNDIERILFSYSEYEYLDFYLDIDSSKTPTIKSINELIKLIWKIKSNDYIYCQYPFFLRPNKMRVVMTYLKKLKKMTLVAIIHDIDSLRWGRGKEKIKEEINFLNKFDYIISHNDSMTHWLRENRCKSQIIELEVFDYLIDNNLDSKNNRTTDVVFAGNLDIKKSKFIYDLINSEKIGFKLNLYGPNFNSDIKNDSIKYCGSFPSNKLIENIEGKFGLIWDGESIETCTGFLGEYTKYNNPHKASMYIAAELPIICWKDMAISKFVEKNRIGICIDKLENINYELDRIDDKEYKAMLENVRKIKKKISVGYYSECALDKVNKIIQSE